MLIEGLVALGSALEAWRRKSAMICWRSANVLSGVGHICAPRRDRPSGRIIPRSMRATTCSRSGGSIPHAECPLKTLHARLTAVSPRSGVGAKASLEAQCGDPSQTTSDCARSKRQIARADRFFIGAEGGGAGAVDDPSLDHDRQPVGNLRGELHVLLDQQDRHPALTKASHDPL